MIDSNQFDQPNLEVSPQDHDNEAIAPGSTEQDIANSLTLLTSLNRIPSTWLDVACGTGRHVAHLRQHNILADGVDLDPHMITAAQQQHPDLSDHFSIADATTDDLHRKYAVLSLFNKSLVCFHSDRQALGIFSFAARHLQPGGVFLIDNSTTSMWQNVKNGDFADGISDDGCQQLFFLDGQNRFVWRRNDLVNDQSWTAQENDRIYRLWSLGEIVLGAASAGLAPVVCAADTPLIALQKAENQPC